jgi:hypothetical protein
VLNLHLEANGEIHEKLAHVSFLILVIIVHVPPLVESNTVPHTAHVEVEGQRSNLDLVRYLVQLSREGNYLRVLVLSCSKYQVFEVLVKQRAESFEFAILLVQLHFYLFPNYFKVKLELLHLFNHMHALILLRKERGYDRFGLFLLSSNRGLGKGRQ